MAERITHEGALRLVAAIEFGAPERGQCFQSLRKYIEQQRADELTAALAVSDAERSAGVPLRAFDAVVAERDRLKAIVEPLEYLIGDGYHSFEFDTEDEVVTLRCYDIEVSTSVSASDADLTTVLLGLAAEAVKGGEA